MSELSLMNFLRWGGAGMVVALAALSLPSSVAATAPQAAALTLPTLYEPAALIDDPSRDGLVVQESRRQAFVLKGGNLDSDAGDDLLSVTGDEIWYSPIQDVPVARGSPVLEGRSGLNSSRRWGVDLKDFARVIPVDLGAPDVLVMTSQAQKTSAVGPYSRSRGTYELERRDGATGELLWRVSGTLSSWYVSKDASVKTTESSPAYVQAMPDATGDGLPDILLGSIDSVESVAIVAGASLVRFVAKVIDGRNGREVNRIQTEGVILNSTFGFTSSTDRMPWITPIDDVDGDGLSEVVALSGIQGSAMIASVRSADAGTVLWNAPVTNVPSVASRFEPYAEDVTGDGTRDVVVIGTSRVDPHVERSPTAGVSVHAFEGGRGTHLWSAQATRAFIVGDADGDGGADIILQRATSSTISLEAVSGLTGTTLWGSSTFSSSPPPGGFTYSYICMCTDDVSGDQVDDIALAFGVFDSRGEVVRVESQGVNGRTGALLWTSPVPSLATLPVAAYGDLDGDGVHDLFATEIVAAEDAAHLRFEAFAGPDLESSWTTTGSGLPVGDYWIESFSAPLIPDGRSQLVTTVSVSSGAGVTTVIDAIDASGPIWRL